MVDLVASISSAVDIAKKLRELGKKVSEADFKMMLAELTDALADAKLEAANLKLQLAEAQEKIRSQANEMQRRQAADPELHDHAYVFGDHSRHYCTGCFDSRAEKVLLRELTGPWANFGKWECPVCEKTFGPAKAG